MHPRPPGWIGQVRHVEAAPEQRQNKEDQEQALLPQQPLRRVPSPHPLDRDEGHEEQGEGNVTHDNEPRKKGKEEEKETPPPALRRQGAEPKSKKAADQICPPKIGEFPGRSHLRHFDENPSGRRSDKPCLAAGDFYFTLFKLLSWYIASS